MNPLFPSLPRFLFLYAPFHPPPPPSPHTCSWHLLFPPISGATEQHCVYLSLPPAITWILAIVELQPKTRFPFTCPFVAHPLSLGFLHADRVDSGCTPCPLPRGLSESQTACPGPGSVLVRRNLLPTPNRLDLSVSAP